MIQLEDIKKKEVISSDGKIIGSVDGVTLLGKWNVGSLAVKIHKDITEELGQKRPLFFSLRLDTKVGNIKAISDKVILNKSLVEMGRFLKEHNEEISAGRIIGLEVIDTQGKLIGHVRDVLLDCPPGCSEWKIPSLLTEIDGDMVETLDLNKKLFRGSFLSLSMKHVNDVADVVMLDIPVEKVTEILDEQPIRNM
jgi:sporulation protein YlmC with PRC-barrel domain